MKVIHGNGDMIAMLEGLLEQANAGTLKGVVVSTVSDFGGETLLFGGRYSHHNSLPTPWALLLASVSNMQSQIARNGLNL